MKNPLSNIGKIRSVKLKIPRCKIKKISSVNWKIRSVEMETPLGKNEKSVQ
jgi:hypothetical protein